jgi:Fe-S-cluster containining protein
MTLYRMMGRGSSFSYRCNACGRCCHNQVITLSPYDLIRLARATNLATGETIERFTLRRGSLLRFNSDGACAVLDGVRCGVHHGRPLACRLYPLGFQGGETTRSQPHALISEGHRGPEFDGSGESFVRLEPAIGSAGIYGTGSTVAAFLESQGTEAYFAAIGRYRSLLPAMRSRIAALANFDRIEPREFWRRAFNEAMRESNYDPNPLIDWLFDADDAIARHQYSSEAEMIDAHHRAILRLVTRTHDGATVAAAAMLLAVSLGYSPAEAIVTG